jgi:hypothetical protein
MQQPSDADAALDEAIAQEERWIELYEAELSLLNSQRSNRDNADHSTGVRNEGLLENNNVTFFENDTSALDWILQLNSNNSDPQQDVSNLLKCVEAETSWLGDRLQPLLRNFCFTSVVCEHSRKNISKQLQEYTFHGYFLANRLVRAKIRMVVCLAGATPNIAEIHCELLSKRDSSEDWSWLQKQVVAVVNETAASNSTHYLAAWVSCVSEYLEFDHLRRAVLLDNCSTHACGCPRQFTVQHVHSKSLLRIPIYPKSSHQQRRQPEDDDSAEDDAPQHNRKPSHVVQIVWGWRWKERRSSLRLTQDGAAVLRQPDLDQLVQACQNDCLQAINLLLTHCSGCTCWRGERGGTDEACPKERTYLQDPVHDADDEGDDEDKEEEDDGVESDGKQKAGPSSKDPIPLEDEGGKAVVDEGGGFGSEGKRKVSSSSKDPFRWSPSGRRRSDYEVRRLERIQRNEQKLSQLGLLEQTGAMINDKRSGPVALTTHKKMRRSSIPSKSLSDEMSSPKNKHSLLPSPRSYPKRSKESMSLNRFSPKRLGGGGT